MRTIDFLNFGAPAHGRIVTGWDVPGSQFTVVKSRNPYGSHNLILVQDGEAIRHGTIAVLAFCAAYAPRKVLRRAMGAMPAVEFRYTRED